MITIVDFTGRIEPHIDNFAHVYGEKFRYASGLSTAAGPVDADTFLRNSTGDNKIWVITQPLVQNDGVCWGKVEAGRGVVSAHNLKLTDVLVVIKHEVGHLRGLAHCLNDCVMNSCHPAEAGINLCHACLGFLRSKDGIKE